jgi:rod shape-determining protein MreC
VVGRSLTPEFRTLIIDAGTADGVGPGMAVVTAEGLVGFVAVAVPHAAKVVLITDASARVDAIIQRTRGQTMVFGRGKSQCTLEYLTDADVVNGDRIITSGIGGVFPKGITVGVVSSINRGQTSAPQGIWLLPVVDLDAVEEVAILAAKPVGEGLTR